VPERAEAQDTLRIAVRDIPQTAASEIKSVFFAEIFDNVLQKLNKKIEETNAVIKLPPRYE